MNYNNVTEIFQTLTRAGAIPGSDFSIDPVDGSLRMNETSYRLLTNLYPDIDWDDIAAVTEIDVSTITQSIEGRLKTNFFERLVTQIHERLSNLPPEQAAWYLTQMLNGVQRQTGLSLYQLLIQNIKASRFFYIEALLKEGNNSKPCHDWLGDLIIAAGGSEDDFEYHDDDVLLTEKGLQLLATVWAGDEHWYEQLANDDPEIDII